MPSAPMHTRWNMHSGQGTKPEEFLGVDRVTQHAGADERAQRD